MNIIKENNFEFVQGLLSRKKNEVDTILITDCTAFCAKSEEPLLVILMSGDVDYLSLIENLTKDGHEVRLVCNSISKINQSLKDIVPSIYDLDRIKFMISQLENNLITFSSLTNYLLSNGNDNSLQTDALAEEIQQYYINDLNKKISSLFKLMQKSPDFNWQYTINNGIIRKNNLVHSTGPNDAIGNRAIARKQGLLFKLGYEENFEDWEKTWLEYKKYETNLPNLKSTLHKLYKIVPKPKVRNNIQKELVLMLFYQQNTAKQQTPKPFRNFASQNPDKPFVCPYCGKSFAQKNSRGQHIRASHRDLK